MPIRPILLYPDHRLKETSAPVASFDQNFHDLITDLLDTMHGAPGCVGVAAPQIGEMHRVIIIDASRSTKPFPNRGQMILVNPVIDKQEGEVLAREGCLSIPDLTANVRRAERIEFRALDTDGREQQYEASGFEARVVLHEYDHLNGILFLDRVASLKTDVFRRKRYAEPAHEPAAAPNQTQ